MTRLILDGIPQTPSMISVTVTNGNLTGSAAHSLGSTPTVGRPNPNVADGLNSYATADAVNVTVTCEAPVSQNVTFTVPYSIS